MNRMLSVFAACLVAVALVATASAEEKKAGPKVAVNALSVKGIDEAAGATLSDLLCTAVARNTKLRVICAEDMKAIIQSSDAQIKLGECESGECLSQLGAMLEVDYVVTGSIGKVGKTHVINLSLFDKANKASSNRVSKECSGGDGDLIGAVKEAGEKLVSGL